MFSPFVSVLTNFASGMAFSMPSRKPFIRPCAQNSAGSPPETANTFSSCPVSFIHFSTTSAAVAPSFGGNCVKLVNSCPREVTPTVNAGMPMPISLLTIAVVASEVVGSIEMQSICPAASLASICDTCSFGLVCTGAIDVHSSG